MSELEALFSKYTEAEQTLLRELCTKNQLKARFAFFPRLIYDLPLSTFLDYYRIHAVPPCLLGSDEALRREVAAAAWPQCPEQVLVALSVRTFTHLLFTALNLPKGSEILFSGISIPQMATVARHHGLVARAFDLDIELFAANVDQAKDLMTEKTRMVICAPLFGTRLLGIEKVRALAKERNIPFFLDIAQAYGVMHLHRDLDPDFSCMSFGSIKFATALGGAIGTVKDKALREKMAAMERQLPQRTWLSMLSVLVKNSSAVMLANDALTCAMVRNVVALFGGDWNQIVNQLSRGFPGPNLIELISRRPPKSQLIMLAKRVGENAEAQKARYREKSVSGWDILSRLPNYVQVVGAGDVSKPLDSTFWLFPVYCRDPIGANHVFHKNGIDSALGTSQMQSMGGGVHKHSYGGNGKDDESTSSASTTPRCDDFIKHILYVPAYPTLGERGRDMLLKTIHSMPRSMIESPAPQFHAHVERSPLKHAYRSAAIAELLKARPLFSEDVPRVFLIGAAGAATAAVVPAVGFALRSML